MIQYGKTEDNATVRYRTCSYCKKRFELPVLAPEEYGWNIGSKHFCRYDHMRAYEREKLNQAEETKTKRLAGHLHVYEKLYKFMHLRETTDMSPTVCAEEAGFSTMKAAASAKQRYRHDTNFLAYVAQRETET